MRFFWIVGRSPSRFLVDRRAVTTWEYAIIAAVVAIAIVGSVTSMGSFTRGPFLTVGSAMNTSP